MPSPKSPEQEITQEIDAFIRDVTKVGLMAKSEVRRRLLELLVMAQQPSADGRTLFYYPPWCGKFIDQACRDITVETSGAYDGEMFRDNFEYLAKQVAEKATRRAKLEAVEEMEKELAQAKALSNERLDYIQGKHMDKPPIFGGPSGGDGGGSGVGGFVEVLPRDKKTCMKNDMQHQPQEHHCIVDGFHHSCKPCILSNCPFAWKIIIQPSNDSLPLSFQKHPRNTVLGASLVLEALFPDLSKEKINELAPLLAEEFEWERRHIAEQWTCPHDARVACLDGSISHCTVCHPTEKDGEMLIRICRCWSWYRFKVWILRWPFVKFGDAVSYCGKCKGIRPATINDAPIR